MNKEEFYLAVQEFNIELTNEQKHKLDLFYKLLVEWNQKMNLTTIIKEEDVYLKHFYDSLTLIKATDLTRNISLCDVGSGAGFPGIVLKIVFPNLKITLIDSLNKRIIYLNEIIRELNLKDIEAIHARMEDYSKKNNEKFEIITARAVSNLNTLTEIAIRSLKIGGKLIFLKGKCEEEINELKRIQKILNIMLIDVIRFKLPIEKSDRSIISIVKEGETNSKYPRTNDKIKKNPL